MAETPKTARVLSFLRKQGDYVYAIKTTGDAFSRVAKPDIIASIYGVFVAIEMKDTKKRPTEAQFLNLDQIHKSGGLCNWFDDDKEAIEWLKVIIKQIRNWINTNKELQSLPISKNKQA